MSEESSAKEQRTVPEVSIRDFFEITPPGKFVIIRGLVEPGTGYTFTPTPIQIHCDGEHCGRPMWFETSDSFYISDGGTVRYHILKFACKNCGQGKVFAIQWAGHNDQLLISKLGEVPRFGKPLPSRLITMVRDEKDLLVKGYSCETQGMGLAALSYYRRIVEDFRTKFIQECKRVAIANGTPMEELKVFDVAAQESRFQKSIELIKDAIPPKLLIRGENPFNLLHSALSADIHNATDGECIELATDIRVVLTQFAEQIGSALAESEQLKAAVAKLARRREGKQGSS